MATSSWVDIGTAVAPSVITAGASYLTEKEKAKAEEEERKRQEAEQNQQGGILGRRSKK